MRSAVRLGVCALCWAILAPYAIAQSETNPPAQVEPPERPARQRPGEYPDYLFREPHPAPVAETSEEFREKYLFGDWLGSRPDLADEGIRPLALFITDPLGNVTGGRRRGFSEYDLLALDLLLDTDKLLGWPGGELHIGFANNSGTSLSHRYVGNNFPVQLADVAHGSYSGDLRRAEGLQALTDPAVGVQSWEMTLEWTYGCPVRPGLLVQPDLQYLINPGGSKAVPNALAMGLNVVFNF